MHHTDQLTSQKQLSCKSLWQRLPCDALLLSVTGKHLIPIVCASCCTCSSTASTPFPNRSGCGHFYQGLCKHWLWPGRSVDPCLSSQQRHWVKVKTWLTYVDRLFCSFLLAQTQGRPVLTRQRLHFYRVEVKGRTARPPKLPS